LIDIDPYPLPDILDRISVRRLLGAGRRHVGSHARIFAAVPTAVYGCRHPDNIVA
jgi:hypothetical protein